MSGGEKQRVGIARAIAHSWSPTYRLLSVTNESRRLVSYRVDRPPSSICWLTFGDRLDVA